MNTHFQAAMRLSSQIQHMYSREAKRQWQSAVLKELLAGLKGGK